MVYMLIILTFALVVGNIGTLNRIAGQLITLLARTIVAVISVHTQLTARVEALTLVDVGDTP